MMITFMGNLSIFDDLEDQKPTNRLQPFDRNQWEELYKDDPKAFYEQVKKISVDKDTIVDFLKLAFSTDKYKEIDPDFPYLDNFAQLRLADDGFLAHQQILQELLSNFIKTNN